MQVGGGAKSGPSEGGRGRRYRMIGQMVTEIVSEAKAGHFAGLVPVILPLLDGRSSHRNGTTGDPDKSAHPVVNTAPAGCSACKSKRRKQSSAKPSMTDGTALSAARPGAFFQIRACRRRALSGAR